MSGKDNKSSDGQVRWLGWLVTGTLVGALVWAGPKPNMREYHAFTRFQATQGQALATLEGATKGALVGFMLDGLINGTPQFRRRFRRREVYAAIAALALFAYGVVCWLRIYHM